MPDNRSNPRGGNLRHDNDAFGANSQSGRGGSWSNRDDDDMQMRNSRQDRPRSAYESELNPRMEQGGSHTSAYGDEHSTSGDRYRDSDDNANDTNRKRGGNQKPGGRDGGDADMGADSWGGAADRDTGRDRYNQSDSAGASVGYNDPDIDRNDYYGNRSMNEGRDSNRASSRDRQSENEGRNRGPGGSNYNAQQPNERQDANTWGNRNTGGKQQRPGGNQGNFGGARRDFGEDGVRNSGSPQRSHEGQGDYGDRYSGREGGSNQFSSWRNDPSDTRSGSQQGMRGDSQRGQQSDQPQRGQHAGRGPKGYRRDDARITEDVNEALTHDHDIDASEIEVKVSGGEVTLSGTVDSREAKRHAEDIAERVSGVSDVNNQIRVARAGATGPSTSHKEGQHMGNKPANDKMSDPNAEKDHKPSTKDGAADGTSTADGAMSSQGSGPSGAANTSTPDKNPSVKNIPSTQGTSAHKTQGRGS